MIFRAWAIRSGPRSTEVRTTRQTVNVGMTSSLFGLGWRKYSLRPRSRVGRSCPLQDENPARPNHADFTGCDYNIELFFRWVKCVLGCRHLLSQTANGVRMQVYVALIASLLISLWVGRTPTKRTYEMLCFYLSGWASETALITHLERLHQKAPPPCKN
jgi:hypothetical protein